jgi:hypothetical protein
MAFLPIKRALVVVLPILTKPARVGKVAKAGAAGRVAKAGASRQGGSDRRARR